MNESLPLLLQEVDLVGVRMLQLQVVFLEVADVLDDLLQDVVGSFSGLMLKCGTLTS